MRAKKMIPFYLVGAVVVLVLFWLLFGNMITLRSCTNKDLEVFNSGSLDVPGTVCYSGSDMPEFVKEMLAEDEQSEDDFTSIISQYLYFERTKIHGFMNGNTVEYTVYAPDMESWILNLNPQEEYTEEELFEEMVSYIPDAPIREQTITVEYFRKGLFKWEGNYETREFADAVSGGINSAYNKLYDAAMEEMEDALS